MNDKAKIRHWLKLYNLLQETDFRVLEYPDAAERSAPAIDALCENSDGDMLALEHTLVQPFEGQKDDDPKFLKTLASLQDDPALVIPGFTTFATIAVGAVPKGIDWTGLRASLLDCLARALPQLAVGRHTLQTTFATATVTIFVDKVDVLTDGNARFMTGRQWPGDPGCDLVLRALRAKCPKLAKHRNAHRILLLEKDSIAGSVEAQFQQLPDSPEICDLLGGIDEVWNLNTSIVDVESVIFTNQVWPAINTQCGSLNIVNGKFWDRGW